MGLGYSAAFGSRDINAVFAELYAPVLKNLELTAAIRYARDRKVFGKTVFDFQNTKFKLAEIATQIKVGRAFIDRCVEDLVAGTLDTVTASMAKLWGSETQGRVIDECLQLFGGAGYMEEYRISLFAQQLGTAEPVSLQRITKALAARG